MKIVDTPPGLPSFENTEIAFRNKSKQDLERAYWLFQIISSNFLTTIGPPITNFALNVGLPIKGIIRATIFRHFCGGETIEGCNKAIADLAAQGVGTILDYSVEGEDAEEVFDHTCEEIIQTVRKAASNPKNIPFSVFKPTGVGAFDLYAKIQAGETLSAEEEAAYTRAKARIDKICQLCHELDVKVLVDAEHSWVQDVFDTLTLDMMRKYNREKAIVFNTYQIYRHDKLASLKADFATAEAEGFYLGGKLVRGAYMEIERERAEKMGYVDPIQPNKAATDRDYNLAVEFCLDHLDRISFMAGSHNEESNLLLASEMIKRNIPANHNHIYFAQLLGMSDHISFNLAASGFNVAKYMPYGPVKAVMPYLFRRAQENTSVAGQTGRELSLLKKEKARRKHSK
jgi:proline dehydrogenase